MPISVMLPAFVMSIYFLAIIEFVKYLRNLIHVLALYKGDLSFPEYTLFIIIISY